MRNPLEEAVYSYDRALPYVGLLAHNVRTRRRRTPGRWWWRRNLLGRRTLSGALTRFLESEAAQPDQVQIMRDKFANAHVRDVVMLVDECPPLEKAVLTVSSELFTDETAEYLLGGRFTVLGKITNVVRDGEIDLLRRSAIEPSVLLHELQRTLQRTPGGRRFEKVKVSSGRDDATGSWSWVIPAPTIQVLPLAIFV